MHVLVDLKLNTMKISKWQYDRQQQQHLVQHTPMKGNQFTITMMEMKDNDDSSSVNDNNDYEEGKILRLEKELQIALKKLSNAQELCSSQEEAIRKAKEQEIKTFDQSQKYKFQLSKAQEKLDAVERKAQIKQLQKSCDDMVKRLDAKRNRCREIKYDDKLNLPIKIDCRRELDFLNKSLEKLERKYNNQQKLLDTLVERNSMDNEMKRAAIEGDALKIRHLIDRGVGVNTPDETDVSPFKYACGQGHTDAVNVMISVADVNNSDGRWTPLHIALEYCQPEITSILVKANANVLKKEENGEYPIHIACRKCCFECVSILVLSNKANVDMRNDMGDTPLHYCARANSYEIASFLLENGANLVLKNADGLTPIVVAKTNHNYEVTKIFTRCMAE